MSGAAFWKPPHPEMYEPPDFTSLPTSEDILHAKDVIQQMEDSLTKEMVALTPAHERVAELEERLAVFKVWIAPIRRLNYDVLSIIFEFCGKDGAKTTFRISAVSRRWRQVVLATPRAWAYPEMRLYRHHPTVQLFLERSSPYPLHARFLVSGQFALTPNVLDRIECLYLSYMPHMRTGVTFPNVTKLFVYAQQSTVRLSELKTTVFPALRHCFCAESITDNGIGGSTLPSGIAPLETLSLVIANEPTWLRVLQSSRQSLVSLQLVRLHSTWSLPPRLQVVVPLLKCLEVQNCAAEGSEWPLDLKTPALETYWQRISGNDSLVHHDINTIKQLCMDRLLELPSLPKLMLLRARRESDALQYLRLISLDPTISPKLERIEVEMVEKISNDVLLAANAANAERVRPISLSARDNYNHLDGTIDTYMCDLDMPCQLHDR